MKDIEGDELEIGDYVKHWAMPRMHWLLVGIEEDGRVKLQRDMVGSLLDGTVPKIIEYYQPIMLVKMGPEELI